MQALSQSLTSIPKGLLLLDLTFILIKIEIEGKLDEEFLTYQHSCSGSLQNYRWMWFASPLFDQIRPMWSDVIRELGLKKRTDGRQQHHLLPLSLYDDLAARFAHGIP